MTTHAATQVLTDAFLFRRITAFQRGLEMPLYEFWRARTPGDAPLRLTFETTRDLVQVLVAHGTPALFDMATRASYCYLYASDYGSSPPESLPLYHIADHALQQDRLEIVEWALVSKNSSLNNIERAWLLAMTQASDNGDTHMLDVLKKHARLPNNYEMNRVLGKALNRTGGESNPQRVTVLSWLVDEVPGFHIPLWMVGFAADRGDFSLLNFLHVHGFTSCDHSEIPTALSSRRFDVLEYLLEHFSQNISSYDAKAIATDDDPEIHRIALQFAEKLQVGCTKYINHPKTIVRQVHLWIERGILSPQWPVSIDSAASNGRLDIVRLLHDHGIAIATTDAMDSAAENGKWDVVEFLHYNRSEGCTTRVMDAALAQGHLKYVKFLYENHSDGFSPLAAEKAASSGSADTIRFLHTHTDVAFTSAVMDKAAACGRVAVVKFLHENRSEGCTAAAMDDACANGYLLVAQYLHDHRSEGCTIAGVRASLRGGLRGAPLRVVSFLFNNYRHLFECDAFDEALVTSAVRSALQPYGQLDVVQFLFDRFPHLFSPDLLHDLLLRGFFDVYSALRVKYPEQADGVLDSVLFQAGETFELPTIRFIIEVLGRRDLAHRAMDGAASREIYGWIHWLRAVYAIAGPTSCRLSAVRLAARRVRGPFRSSIPEVFESVAYLVGVCCEPNAQQVATTELDNDLTSWDTVAEQAKAIWDQPLHPFLVDPRVASWAISDLLPLLPCRNHPVSYSLRSQSWPVLAAYRHDISMLEVLRDMAPMLKCTHASHCKSINADDAAKLLSFEGTRDAAIAMGNLAVLQWLMEHIDLPVEPTLLGEALFCDQREIAEWLVDRHPEACTQAHWRPQWSLNPRLSNFLTDDMLDWLDDHHAVRNAPAFDGIVDYLVRVDDTNALRRLHARHPEIVMGRTNLLELERVSKTSDVVDWLQEVGYRGH